jgi:hypothetical protein
MPIVEKCICKSLKFRRDVNAGLWQQLEEINRGHRVAEGKSLLLAQTEYLPLEGSPSAKLRRIFRLLKSNESELTQNGVLADISKLLE